MALGGTVHSPYLRARQQYPSVKHMLTATCHCGLVRIEIPNAPEKVTSCNCSICRRLGVLWGYYDVDQVNVVGHPENTDGIAHFGFHVQNFSLIIETCESLNIPIPYGVVVWEKSRSVYIVDPNGYEIELSEVFGGGLGRNRD